MGKKVIYFNKIIRGFDNRNKNFKKGEVIQLDDEGFVRQEGVDEYGIPIIYKEYEYQIKEFANCIRKKENKPEYDRLGYKTSIGLTKNELICFAENNFNEILLDSPGEIKEFQSELKKFIEKWEEKLGKKKIVFGHQDDSDIWSGREFVENKFAKTFNEEYDSKHPKPTIKRPQK